VRNMDAFGPKLDRERLRQTAHGKLCAAKCNRSTAAARQMKSRL
jgi:hypothetical protein